MFCSRVVCSLWFGLVFSSVVYSSEVKQRELVLPGLSAPVEIIKDPA